MGQQQTKTSYYEALQQNRAVDMSNVNPLEVMGLSKDYTWDELVASYRRLAKLVHPDKGGSEMLFQTVTECFKYLAHEFKKKDADKPHHILKQNYEMSQGMGGQGNQGGESLAVPVQFRNAEEFQDKFNKAFEENRLGDEELDFGYGHMMAESSKNREDFEIPKVLGTYSRKKFNEAFEKHVPAGKEVIIYKEPEPMLMAKSLQFTELGGKTTDFGTDPSRKTNLQYTDYMKAHTNSRLVDTRAVQQRKEYKSVEDYEADRAKITQRRLDESELRHQKEIEEYKKKQEEERLQRLQSKDMRISEHFEKVNKLFLGR